jgi:type IV secretory pathway TrbF-like protein
MRTNRVHYTRTPTPKAPTIASKNCFKVALGVKTKAKNWPFYLMLGITAIAIGTQDNLLGIIAGIYIFFYVINKIEAKQ